MSQIAEHHAVHDEEAHGDDQRRVQLVVRRKPESRDELFERLQPARASNQARNALAIGVGLEHLHRDRMAGGALHRLFYSVQVAGRHPSRNQEDFAMFGETPDGFREFSVRRPRGATSLLSSGESSEASFCAFAIESR